MSWVGGGWDQDWSGGGGGNGDGDAAVAATTHIPTLTSWLKPKAPIKISTRYKALEEEEEEEESSGHDGDSYGDEEDSEPGNMTREADPNSRADKVCPCGGIRNWWQQRCDCGTGMHWPVEEGDCLDGMFRCKGHKD